MQTRAACCSTGFLNGGQNHRISSTSRMSSHSHPPWRTNRLRWLNPWMVSHLEEDYWSQVEAAPHIISPQNPRPTSAGSGEGSSTGEKLYAEKGRESRFSSERSNTRIPGSAGMPISFYNKTPDYRWKHGKVRDGFNTHTDQKSLQSVSRYVAIWKIYEVSGIKQRNTVLSVKEEIKPPNFTLRQIMLTTRLFFGGGMCV